MGNRMNPNFHLDKFGAALPPRYAENLWFSVAGLFLFARLCLAVRANQFVCWSQTLFLSLEGWFRGFAAKLCGKPLVFR